MTAEVKSMRNCVFTLNNYTEEEYKKILDWKCNYIVIGKEVGESGTPHLQGYVEWDNSKKLQTLKNLNPRIHWEKRKGTAYEASNYCKKDGQFIEKGQISNQGARHDLNELKDKIMKGEKKVDDIVLEDPQKYHQYGRTLQKIEDLKNREIYRTWRTKGIWLFGETQTGKTYRAYKEYCSLNPKETYRFKDDKGWQDGYAGQQNVIINEFRGHIPYSELLDLVDEWPYELRRRGREPIPFLAKMVVVTSPMPPEEVYHNLAARDKLEQIYERFTVLECISKTESRQHKWSEGNTKPLTNCHMQHEYF